MLKRLDRFVPRFTYLPLIVMLAMNLLTYYCSKLISHHTGHHEAWELVIGGVNLDRSLPVVPFFITFYILAYLQWVVGYFFICRESRAVGYRIASAELIGKVICMLFFIAWPMWLARPEVTGNDFFSWTTRLIYSADEPTNLFPSIHCLESWLCFRGAVGLKKMPKWYAPFQLVFSLFVFASTVLVRQHVLLDIIAGIAVAEIGLFLSKRLRAERIFSRTEPAWVRCDRSDDPVSVQGGAS